MDLQTTQASASASVQPSSISVDSLRRALHEELEYADVLVSTPFRVLQRRAHLIEAAWRPEAEDAIRAVEGMVRLPLKMLADMTEASNTATVPDPQVK
jgi:DNA-binding response OmpR family regulator